MATPAWMLDTIALSDLNRNPRGAMAHARSRGMTLVMHNPREFSGVPGLQVEDWLAPPA